MLTLYSGAASPGFRLVGELIESLSAAGYALLIVWTFLCFLLMVCERRWYPRLVVSIVAREFVGVSVEWIALPGAGGVIPAILYFFVAPLFSLFSYRPDAWWLLMLFCWGAVAVIIYFFYGVRHLNTAVMKTAEGWFISVRGGLGGWNAVGSPEEYYMQRVNRFGEEAYELHCIDANGKSSVVAYIPMTAYHEDIRKNLWRFIREYLRDDNERQ